MQLHKLNPVVKYLPENTEGRDFVVGDLHGCITLLGSLLRHVEFDGINDRLISVGDLVDRGENSFRCLQLLDQPWFHSVIGNHEDLLRYSMLMELKQMGLEPDEVRDVSFQECAGQKWVHQNNGGDWINSPKFTLAFSQKYFRKINELPLVIVVGKDTPDRYHVVHSEILSSNGTLVTNDVVDNDCVGVHPINMYWGRNIFNDPNAFLPRWQEFQSADLAWTYCGHTPKDKPMRVGRQINLDTCGFYADYISKENNGSKGLTICNPKTWEFITINGATHEFNYGVID